MVGNKPTLQLIIFHPIEIHKNTIEYIACLGLLGFLWGEIWVDYSYTFHQQSFTSKTLSKNITLNLDYFIYLTSITLVYLILNLDI